MWKFLIGLAVAYLAWRLWHGTGPLPGTPRPGPPPRPQSSYDPDPVEPADVSEARAVLGVGPDAGPDEIRAAHRRLVAAVHPDRGGSAELTSRINAARERLLRHQSN